MSSQPPARRCQAHDLAAASDGLCVVCRRASPSVTTRVTTRVTASTTPSTTRGAPIGSMAPEPRGLLQRLATALLGIGLLGSLAACAWVFVVQPRQRAAAAAAAATQRLPRGQALRAKPTAHSPEQERREQDFHEAHDAHETREVHELYDYADHLDDQAPGAGVPALPEQDLLNDAYQREQRQHPATNARAQRDQEAERDRRRHAQVMADIASRELAAARRSVSVAIYTTPWCGACTRAKAYMREHDISFVEHDIEQSTAARDRQRALNPRRTVPTFEVGDQVLVGFGAASLNAALDRAARN